jgi:outer membrane immunogenic protein
MADAEREVLSARWTHAYGWGDGSINGLTGTVDLNGGFGGGQIGYNFQSGNIVWGVEVDSAWADLGKSNTIFFGASSLTSETKIDYMGSARGRVGYAPGNALWYATGGVAWMHNEISFSAVVPPFAVGIASDNTHVGWTVGAGVEWAFLPSWSAKVEYLYADYGSQTYFSGIAGGFSADAKVSTIKFGVNYLFH